MSGFNEFLAGVTILPEQLKSLSDAELVAGMDKYLLANLESVVDSRIFHHSSGSSSLSIVGLERYVLISREIFCSGEIVRPVVELLSPSVGLRKVPSVFLLF